MRPPHQPNLSNGTKVNQDITASQVRLVDEDGENLGLHSLEDALRKAEAKSLDLVEIAPLSRPPVCKILDFGRFKYQVQKRKNEAKKKQKNIEVKEIKLRPNIDTHDYEVKMRAVRRFLEEGDKVKLTMRFRGREMSHPERGRKVLDRVREEFVDISRTEQEVAMEGRQMTLVLGKKA